MTAPGDKMEIEKLKELLNKIDTELIELERLYELLDEILAFETDKRKYKMLKKCQMTLDNSCAEIKKAVEEALNML